MSLSLLAMLAITQMNVLDGCDRRWNEQWRQVIVIDPVSWIIILLLFIFLYNYLINFMNELRYFYLL